MCIHSWGDFGSTRRATRNPRLTVRCEYPDTDMPPTEVTFRLSPSYGLLTAREAHDWFGGATLLHFVAYFLRV